MSRILYDFKCSECGHIKEALVHSYMKSIWCECGATMDRLISTPTIKLDGTDPGFPDAYDKWARSHEKQAKIETAKLDK